MFFPDLVAKDFARYHDDVIDAYGSRPVKIPGTEHMQLHGELRKCGGEEQLIDYWINILFERPA